MKIYKIVFTTTYNKKDYLYTESKNLIGAVQKVLANYGENINIISVNEE